MQQEKQIVIYKTPAGDVSVSAIMQEDTLWLTQAQMAELFEIDKSGISRHIKDIFTTGELSEKVVCAKFAHTTPHGAIPDKTQTKEVLYYNLDMIIAVGYRVNSAKATAFRIWATNVLKEYIQKGFALDDNRLKNGYSFDKAHFRELLERIKEIRTSERMLYQQLKDIYALSEDYMDDNTATLLFFAHVQDKVHYAITGQSAAEIVYKRVDANKKNLGMTTWKTAPNGRFTKQDVIVAKNFLEQPELENLRDIVNMFLDYAELQAKNATPVFMKDWITELDNFLKFLKKPVLDKVRPYSRTQAVRKAYAEYAKYRENERLAEREKAKLEYIEDIKELEKLLKTDNKN